MILVAPLEIEVGYGKDKTKAGSILAGYTASYSLTREVAEAVAAKLGENGFKVNLQPLRKVRTLEAYHAFLLGVPHCLGHWRKDLQHFLS